MRLAVIRHKQTVHAKRKAPLFACTFVLADFDCKWCRHLGISNEVCNVIFKAVSIKGNVLSLYALA